MKLVHWPLTGGMLRLVQPGDSDHPHINSQGTNHYTVFTLPPPPSPLLWAMACHDGNGYNCTYSMLTEIWSSVVLESIGRICQLPAPPMCSSKWWKSRKLARWPTLRTVIFSWAHLEYKCRSIATPTWLVASSKTTLSTPKYNINNTAEDPMLWYSRV